MVPLGTSHRGGTTVQEEQEHVSWRLVSYGRKTSRPLESDTDDGVTTGPRGPVHSGRGTHGDGSGPYPRNASEVTPGRRPETLRSSETSNGPKKNSTP